MWVLPKLTIAVVPICDNYHRRESDHQRVTKVDRERRMTGEKSGNQFLIKVLHRA